MTKNTCENYITEINKEYDKEQNLKKKKKNVIKLHALWFLEMCKVCERG